MNLQNLFIRWKVFLWSGAREELGSFEEELHFQARKFFFFIVTLTTFVWLPYIDIDKELNPNANFAIPFRYGMSLLSVILLSCCAFSKFLRERCEWLMRVMVVYVLLSVAIITAASEAHPNYIAGYFICLLSMSFVPQPLWHQWFITILSVALYFSGCFYFDVKFDSLEKQYGLQDTISVLLVCLIFGYALNKLRQSLYDQTISLRNKTLQLEQHLKERTSKLESTYDELKHSLEGERKKEVELEFYEEMMSKMSDRVHEDKEKERLDIADHIHGTVGQDLALSKQKIDELLKDTSSKNVAEGLNQLSEYIRTAISDTRLVVRNMNLRVLKEYGLESALEELFLSVESVQGLVVTKFYGEGVFERVSKELEQYLFRATQELLNNIIKYAKVDRAYFSLRIDAEKIVCCVSDEGVGTTILIPELKKDGGFGLYRMKERTLELGGDFMMDSHLNKGLVVTLTFYFSDAMKA